MSYDELMAEADSNSALWHTYDSNTQEGRDAQKALENRNNAIFSYSDAVYGTKTTPLSADGTREHSFDADAYYQSLVSRGGDGDRTYSPQPVPSFSEWMQGGEYQMLSDQYSKLGQQSMENILAQLSARTGGLASSYAAQVAQQGYNDYMDQLMEVARSMYEGDRAAMLAENEAAYDRYRDSVSDANYERQLQYDLAAQQAAKDEKDEADARDRVLQQLAMNGDLSALDSSLLGATGLTDEELQGYADYYTNLIAAQEAEAAKKSTGGGGTPAPKLGVLDTILGMDRSHAEDYLMSNVGKDHVARYLEMYDEAKKAEAAKIMSYNDLSKSAKSKLTSMQLQMRRDGGLTEAQKNSLSRAVESGEITEEELEYMMQVLGI